MAHRVFGIRHHGPGCARSLREALASYAPDAVLLEGPPDADEALALVVSEDLKPPVALLVHSVEKPEHAVFYPFAVFSPEWQALRFAAERKIPHRFMDLPTSHRLALELAQAEKAADPESTEDEKGDVEEEDPELEEDPLGLLAEAAGFEDREQWWDVQIERRQQAEGLFDAIQEAMTHLRTDLVPRKKVEQQREAFMRATIRKAEKEGFQRIAVVCGAWHAPALVELGGVRGSKQDSETLKGLPKTKVAAAWIPWTYSRLSYRSGYGAGVDSPGFYAHVWEHQARAPLVWAVRAARLLRQEDVEASSANVIETVRLAESLAAMRELPAPGLGELREALLAVLCGGDAARLALIRDKLEVGDELGTVPENAAQVPLQRDFEREVKRLRLKLTTEQLFIDLDLRKDNDRDKSRLFHRLRVLGIVWAEPVTTGRTSGTFKESWKLVWDPEFVVELVAANLYGNTVEVAARARLVERARQAQIAELSRLVEVALVADLPGVLADLLSELDARAAQASDVRLLFDSTEPLARVIRYGDVRGARAPSMLPVFRGLLERAVVGLLPASGQLDDDAAASLLESIGRAHAACLLLDDAELKALWLDALRALLESEGAHPRLRGRACRLLLEQHRVEGPELERRANLALSPAVEPGQAARWLEGLVAGDGLFLVHHAELIATLDAWLASLSSEIFQAELPLLRRAFSSFAPAERRALAQKLKRNGTSSPRRAELHADLDPERARRVLPVLASVLGVSHE
jgi:hypothetical protein